jgi:hypothetical protein
MEILKFYNSDRDLKKLIEEIFEYCIKVLTENEDPFDIIDNWKFRIPLLKCFKNMLKGIFTLLN